jgi:hypothetical protein
MKFFQKRRKEEDAGIENISVSPEKLESGDQEKAIEGITSAPIEAVAEIEYVTGWKLWSMLAALVLIFFLVLLDMSVVATVSRVVSGRVVKGANGPDRLYPKLPPAFIHCTMSAGTEAHICWRSKCSNSRCSRIVY